MGPGPWGWMTIVTLVCMVPLLEGRLLFGAMVEGLKKPGRGSTLSSIRHLARQQCSSNIKWQKLLRSIAETSRRHWHSVDWSEQKNFVMTKIRTSHRYLYQHWKNTAAISVTLTLNSTSLEHYSQSYILDQSVRIFETFFSVSGVQIPLHKIFLLLFLDVFIAMVQHCLMTEVGFGASSPECRWLYMWGVHV